MDHDRENELIADARYWRKRYEATQRELDKMPKGSFICISIKGIRKTEWKMETAFYLNDKDSVRKNNHLSWLCDQIGRTLVGENTAKLVEEGETRKVYVSR